ncbi:MAG: Glu-tRNA(Gln) amidotransferase subunit GatE [Planctomycetes bacterium]|nr:Glu-tRNA(Gln) amidotransferase subunit GatE [Planctomycetota bacterium]
MAKIDYNDIGFYQSLGFKSGVEIHQQILTKKKTFCHCPAGKYSKTHDAEVLRHMRPTLSELGEYDGCALMEFKTKKNVVYCLNRESVCTYEMDDTPPFLVNREGLDIVIELALMLNCSIVDELHIARKQYLDGSIPTGFQRTAVVGINGWIPYKDRRINISHVCYEEDACRQISNIGHTIKFRTDRLGMPLIEIITQAEMRTPEEMREVVREISRLIRTSGKLRRGIGSVRQDVNGSIAGGSRVEIKGVPQINWIPRLLHTEAIRQKELLDIKKILSEKGVSEKSLKTVKADLTEALSKTKSNIMRENLEKGNAIGGIKLPKLGGIFNHPTQTGGHTSCKLIGRPRTPLLRGEWGKTFADEVAGRLRVIACLDNMPNFFHTDKYPKYPGSDKDLAIIKKKLGLKKGDLGALVWGSKQDVETALNEVRLRVVDAINGVPNETRQPFKNGITDFERILPGPNRMYPDTDSPPVKITPEMVQKIRANIKEPPSQKERRYTALGLPYQIARDLSVSPRANLMDKLIKDKNVSKVLAGATLTQTLKHLEHKGISVEKIKDESIIEIFSLYSKGKFYKEAIPVILEKLRANPSAKVKDIISKNKLIALPESKTKAVVATAIKKSRFKAYSKTSDNLLAKKTLFYAGKIMKTYRGRIKGDSLIPAIMEKLPAK